MRCPQCGHEVDAAETERCPKCQKPLSSRPGTLIEASQAIGNLTGGEAAAVKIGEAGDVTIVLDTFGTSDEKAGAFVPVVSQYSFIGREKELNELMQALKEGRKVQLYGLGGIGKTALAAESAEALKTQDLFPRGILWVSEIGEAPLEAICDAIARHLRDRYVLKLPAGLKPDATRDLLAQWGQMLIILDQIETPETVKQFVDRCLPPGYALLTTSRSRHLASDRDLFVSPLLREEAISLFRAYAQLDKDPTREPIIADICEFLGYHTLAIVIAAGRVRAEALPLESLRRRLGNEKSRIKALGMGSDRAQSLWASLNLSYQDLNTDQRQVFHLLAACFSDSTGLQMLSEISGKDEFDCEDLVGQLVQRSLVERRGDRFFLQRVVRDFSRSLQADALVPLQENALQSLLSYARRYSDNKPDHFDHLETELNNLLGAIQWAVEHDHYEEALALMKIIGRPVSGVLVVRGYWAQLVSVGKLVIHAAEEKQDNQNAAYLMQTVAIGLHRQDAYQEASNFYQRSLALYRELGDRLNIAVATHHLGMLAISMCQYQEAVQLFEQSYELYQTEKDDIGASRSLHELGRLASIRGDYGEAQRLFNESLHIKESKPDWVGAALVRISLGDISRQQGEWEEAKKCYTTSQRVYMERNDGFAQAIIAEDFGRIAQEQGRYEEAKKLYQQAGDVFEKLADQDNMAENYLEQGRLARDIRQLQDSRLYFEKSLRIYEQLSHQSGISWTQMELGWLAIEDGNLSDAHKLIETSKIVFETSGEMPALARNLHLLGRTAFMEGDCLHAIALTEQSLLKHQSMNARPWIARDLHRLGCYAASTGDKTTAGVRLEQAADILVALGSAYINLVRQDIARLEQS